MEIELGDIAGLPEALKAYAVETDGKFKLDLARVAQDSEAWKGKAVTAQSESIDRRKALKAWEALGATPDEVHAKLAKGADPAIIAGLQAKLADVEAGNKARMGDVLGRVAGAELRAELAKAGIVPNGQALLASFAMPRIQFDDEGMTRIMAPDGKTPMIGGGTNGGATMADLARELAASIPDLLADKGVGGGGKPAGSGGGKPGNKITRAAWDVLDHSARAAFHKTGGIVEG